jgi:flagellar motility protein MotE (MotC chaperone)
MAKENEKEPNTNTTQEEEQVENSSKEKAGLSFYLMMMGTVFLMMCIVAGGLLFFMISRNVNNVAFKNRRILEKIPILSLAIPAASDPEAVQNFNEAQLRKKYGEVLTERNTLRTEVDDLQKNLATTQVALKEWEDKNLSLENEMNRLEREKAQMQSLRENLEQDRLDLSKKIATQDIERFRVYYEELDSETAGKIYESVLLTQQANANKQELAKVYETMPANAAAGLLEELMKKDKNVVIDIMRYMKRDSAGQILSVMDKSQASQISVGLAQNN